MKNDWVGSCKTSTLVTIHGVKIAVEDSAKLKIAVVMGDRQRANQNN